jgi:hypothetical protein
MAVAWPRISRQSRWRSCTLALALASSLLLPLWQRPLALTLPPLPALLLPWILLVAALIAQLAVLALVLLLLGSTLWSK